MSNKSKNINDIVSQTARALGSGKSFGGWTDKVEEDTYQDHVKKQHASREREREEREAEIKAETEAEKKKDVRKESAELKEGAVGGALGGAATGAAIGQMLIPIPFLGAAIGAGVGGIAGGVAGSNKKFKEKGASATSANTKGAEDDWGDKQAKANSIDPNRLFDRQRAALQKAQVNKHKTGSLRPSGKQNRNLQTVLKRLNPTKKVVNTAPTQLPAASQKVLGLLK